MSKIRIVNMRVYEPRKKNEILIKVDKSSKLGNPAAGNILTEWQRKIACDFYETYFEEQMENNEDSRYEVKFINDCLKKKDLM